jgi:murein L,D-transpeptidase YcbB/YkuD
MDPHPRIAPHRGPFVLLALLLATATSAAPPVTPSADPVAEVLRERLEQLETSGSIAVGRDAIASRHALPQLYAKHGFQPFWTRERLTVLLELLRDADSDGLLPSDYHRVALAGLIPAITDPAATPLQRAQLDLLATDAFHLLLYHLYLGKVDPVALDPNWNYAPRGTEEIETLAQTYRALTDGSLREAVAEARPSHWLYAWARDALAQYRALAAHGGWPSVPAGGKLARGMDDPRVLVLRHRLAVTGDLPAGAADSTVFDDSVELAVRHFQRRHRLTDDGVVGPGTLAELNVPVEDRIRQIRANLERGRWVLHAIGTGDLVLVDIAGFEVRYLRDRKTLWQSRVQVGKPFRQTPVFRSAIDHVVFNPTWTVPPTILGADILPAVRRNPAYLAQRGLRVIDRTGAPVATSSIDWSRYTGRNFPYLLRQDPGPDNALGRVKIMFPNPYLVYMHDTPSQSLFGQDDRTFSSGCIRVERPFELVALLLDAPETWNTQSMAAVVATNQTRTVRLPKPVPVLLLYWTVAQDAEGRVAFKRDPYGRDARLLQALDAPFKPGTRPAP